jgi:hypothetical protein
MQRSTKCGLLAIILALRAALMSVIVSVQTGLTQAGFVQVLACLRAARNGVARGPGAARGAAAFLRYPKKKVGAARRHLGAARRHLGAARRHLGSALGHLSAERQGLMQPQPLEAKTPLDAKPFSIQLFQSFRPRGCRCDNGFRRYSPISGDFTCQDRAPGCLWQHQTISHTHIARSYRRRERRPCGASPAHDHRTTRGWSPRPGDEIRPGPLSPLRRLHRREAISGLRGGSLS